MPPGMTSQVVGWKEIGMVNTVSCALMSTSCKQRPMGIKQKRYAGQSHCFTGDISASRRMVSLGGTGNVAGGTIRVLVARILPLVGREDGHLYACRDRWNLIVAGHATCHARIGCGSVRVESDRHVGMDEPGWRLRGADRDSRVFHPRLGVRQLRFSSQEATVDRPAAIAVEKDGPSSSLELKSTVRKINFIDESVTEYVVSHTRETEILAKLRKETSFLIGGGMQSTADTAQFLAMLVELTGAKRTIEVGVFTGYSSLAVLRVLPNDGKLVACDMDGRSLDIARRYFEEAGVLNKVDFRIGRATETLQALLLNDEAETYDFAFIDADKKGYLGYYELLLKLVRPGGLIVVDNVIWKGKVADPSVTDPCTMAIRHFNAYVLKDDRVSASMVTVGDGLMLLRKRP